MSVAMSACTSKPASVRRASKDGSITYEVPGGWHPTDKVLDAQNTASEQITLEPDATLPAARAYRLAIFVLRATSIAKQAESIRQGLSRAEAHGTKWSVSAGTVGGRGWGIFNVTAPKPCPSGSTSACVLRIYVGTIGTTNLQINFAAGSNAAFDAQIKTAERIIASLRQG